MFPHKQSSDSSSVSEEKNQLPIKNQSFLQSNFLVNFLVNFAIHFLVHFSVHFLVNLV